MIECYQEEKYQKWCTVIKLRNILYKEKYANSINGIIWAIKLGAYLGTQKH